MWKKRADFVNVAASSSLLAQTTVKLQARSQAVPRACGWGRLHNITFRGCRGAAGKLKRQSCSDLKACAAVIKPRAACLGTQPLHNRDCAQAATYSVLATCATHATCPQSPAKPTPLCVERPHTKSLQPAGCKQGTDCASTTLNTRKHAPAAKQTCLLLAPLPPDGRVVHGLPLLLLTEWAPARVLRQFV